MKGVLFTELMAFVEQTGGADFAEQVLEAAGMPNGGVFTTVGTYPAANALALVDAASKLSGIPADALCRDYGHYLFDRFTELYPKIIGGYVTAEEMLSHVGSQIHEEVTVIYPDATPPQVLTREEDGALIVEYLSHRPLAHIAYGLVSACLEHFGDPRRVEWVAGDELTSATFRIAA